MLYSPALSLSVNRLRSASGWSEPVGNRCSFARVTASGTEMATLASGSLRTCKVRCWNGNFLSLEAFPPAPSMQAFLTQALCLANIHEENNHHLRENACKEMESSKIYVAGDERYDK